MMYGSWDMECKRQFFVILDHFLPLYPPMDPENQNFLKDRKKNLHTLSFYKHDSHMCMVPQIWSATNRLFCHFGPFFALFYNSTNLKNQNFKKMKKPLGDIIALHMYHKWKSYVWLLRYGTSDGQNFLSFWTIFCPFTLLTTQKIKILKKWKKYLEILSFFTSVA